MGPWVGDLGFADGLAVFFGFGVGAAHCCFFFGVSFCFGKGYGMIVTICVCVCNLRILDLPAVFVVYVCKISFWEKKRRKIRRWAIRGERERIIGFVNRHTTKGVGSFFVLSFCVFHSGFFPLCLD